jgi:hypothetical protein
MVKYWTGKLALLGTGGLIALLGGAEAWAQLRGGGEAKTVQGTVRQFTSAPKGEVDGLVLDDGTVVHWPPHLERKFTAILAKGDRVRATGRMETGPAGDTHFEVQAITNLRTNASAEVGEGPPPPPPGPKGPRPAPAPNERDARTVRGTVQRFTTAPRGEVDGLVLDDATVVHWPPHLQDRFKAILDKGDRVRVTGRMETGPAGDTHLEVATLTNLRTGVSRDNDAGPPPAPGRLASDGPRDTEQRLQNLEDKVDRLLREIERLRRDR